MSTEVRQWLDKDGPDAASGSKDDLLAISFAQDMRNASIKFRNQIYQAKVVITLVFLHYLLPNFCSFTICRASLK